MQCEGCDVSVYLGFSARLSLYVCESQVSHVYEQNICVWMCVFVVCVCVFVVCVLTADVIENV